MHCCGASIHGWDTPAFFAHHPHLAFLKIPRPPILPPFLDSRRALALGLTTLRRTLTSLSLDDNLLTNEGLVTLCGIENTHCELSFAAQGYQERLDGPLGVLWRSLERTVPPAHASTQAQGAGASRSGRGAGAAAAGAADISVSSIDGAGSKPVLRGVGIRGGVGTRRSSNKFVLPFSEGSDSCRPTSTTAPPSLDEADYRMAEERLVQDEDEARGMSPPSTGCPSGPPMGSQPPDAPTSGAMGSAAAVAAGSAPPRAGSNPYQSAPTSSSSSSSASGSGAGSRPSRAGPKLGHGRASSVTASGARSGPGAAPKPASSLLPEVVLPDDFDALGLAACTKLTKLSLSNVDACARFAADVLGRTIASRLPALAELDFSQNWSDDGTCRLLADYLVYGKPTSALLHGGAIPRVRPHLRSLRMLQCLVTPAGAQSVRRTLPAGCEFRY